MYQVVLDCLKTKNKKLSLATVDARSTAKFGTTVVVLTQLWNELVGAEACPKGGRPVHLLWGMSLLKTYDTVRSYATTFGIDENTFSKWSQAFVRAVASMKHLVSTIRMACMVRLYLPVYIY
jgi:hypothetical protein